MNRNFKQLFSVPVPVIAMIHLKALPGTPAYQGNDRMILDAALEEAESYLEAGVQGLMIENMHDVPYLRREVGPEIVATMSVVARAVKERSGLPCGVQVLAGANKAALAVAKAAGLDFIRAEGFVFSHIADEGQMDADAGELLRYRKMIDAEHVFILTDIKKKHSAHSITSDVKIAETARAAAFFRSDGLIVTGTTTGKKVDLEELEKVKSACSLPVLIGSGARIDNVKRYLPFCDGLIVGSSFKEKGHWANRLDLEQIRRFIESL